MTKSQDIANESSQTDWVEVIFFLLNVHTKVGDRKYTKSSWNSAQAKNVIVHIS